MEEMVQKQPMPWEQRNQVGLFKALWETVKQVLLHPGAFFGNLEIKKSIKDSYLFYLIISVPVAIITTSFSLLFKHSPDIALVSPSVLSTLIIITIFVVIPVAIFITAAVIHLGVLIFGGKGGYKATLNVVSYASSASVFSLIPLVGGLISWAWYIVVAIIGLKRVHKIGTGRAIGAYFIIPVILLVIVGALLITGIVAERKMKQATGQVNVKPAATLVK